MEQASESLGGLYYSAGWSVPFLLQLGRMRGRRCVFGWTHRTKTNCIKNRHVIFGTKPKCFKSASVWGVYFCALVNPSSRGCRYHGNCCSLSLFVWICGSILPQWSLPLRYRYYSSLHLHMVTLTSLPILLPPIIHSSSCYIYEHYFMLRLCKWKCLQAHRQMTSCTIIHCLYRECYSFMNYKSERTH